MPTTFAVSPLGSCKLVQYLPLDDGHLLCLKDGIVGNASFPWHVWTVPRPEEDPLLA